MRFIPTVISRRERLLIIEDLDPVILTCLYSRDDVEQFETHGFVPVVASVPARQVLFRTGAKSSIDTF